MRLERNKCKISSLEKVTTKVMKKPAKRIYYIHKNHLGAAVLLTNTSRNTVLTIDYSPFGKATLDGSITYNPRLPGQYQDNDFVYYNGYRYYEPATGRYLQPEPAYQSPETVINYAFAGYPLNPYTYALSSPLRVVDPTGRDIWIEGWSGNEPPGHLSLSVGDPLGEYTSFSFGSQNGKIIGPGEVYIDKSGPGLIDAAHYIKTTHEEDKQVIDELMNLIGITPDTYFIVTNNCRHWTQQKFDEYAKRFNINSPGRRGMPIYLPESEYGLPGDPRLDPPHTKLSIGDGRGFP